MNLKIGILVSYDYCYLFETISLIYEDATSITLAVDKNRTTWSGNLFHLPNEFFDMISGIDTQNKIKIYEDNFFLSGLTSVQNETRERNLLAEFMEKGGWHVQIDSDEYFVNFSGLVKFLKTKENFLLNPEERPVNVCCFWKNLYKKTSSGYLMPVDKTESFVCATNYPKYVKGRYIKTNEKLYAPIYVLHQNLARDEQEVKFKFANWGHSNDFDTDKYFSFWESVNENNYYKFKNLHPISRRVWKKLLYCEGKTILEVVRNLKVSNRFDPPYFLILFLNSFLYRLARKLFRIYYQRLKYFLNSGFIYTEIKSAEISLAKSQD